MVPRRGSDTFISAIGHLDPRIDLSKSSSSLSLAGLMKETEDSPQAVHRALMDLCILASKTAYENANVVENIVTHHWKVCLFLFSALPLH